MVYADYTFYTDKYLQGKEAVINTADFPFFALKATKAIKQYTFDNIDENEPIIEEVQMCCCELAEYFFDFEHQSKNQTNGILSEKVGELSITYESGKSKEEYRQNITKGIIYTWLSSTGLLYRGC